MDMRDRQTRIAKLLAQVYLFQGFQQEDLYKIADRCITVKKDVNQVIVSENNPIVGLFIVDRGEVQLEINRRWRKSQSKLVGSAEFFNQESLLSKKLKPIPARTTRPSTLYLLKSQDYDWVIQEFPGVKKTLETIATSRIKGYTHTFPWLRPGEMIYFVSQKHFYFLLKSLILPMIFFLLSFPLISWGIASYASNPGFNFFLFCGAILFFGALFWCVWNYLDWSNDYYLVTNQETTWLEKVILLYDSRTSAPLETIIAVDTSTPNPIARFLKFGDVKARTYTGVINMRYATEPDQMRSFIDGLRSRREYFMQAENIEEIRRAVNEAFQKHKRGEDTAAIPVIKAPPAAKPANKKETEKKPFITRFSNMFKIRYEEDGVITYRKYWPLLIGKIWLPFLFLLIWFVAAGLMVSGKISSSLLCFSGFFLILTGIGLILWLIYGFVDWRNDLYRLTADQVIDLEKKPLGTESKTTADLKNILSIEHERLGFIGNILNYGNVNINVGDIQLTFNGVFNPDQVHYDVSGKREEFRRREDRKKAEQERDRMIIYMLAFYDASSDVDTEHIVRSVYSMLKRRFPGLYAGGATGWQTPQPSIPAPPAISP